MNKCVFLDRDGVINKDFVDYAYTLDRFIILPGVKEAVHRLRKAGYLLFIVTNQSGIAKGIYTREQMLECHAYMERELEITFDKIYYSPWHQTISESLSRKPGTLMFEKAVARFDIDISQSWMVGDHKRDIEPAQKMRLKTIQVGDLLTEKVADYWEKDLLAAISVILRG